MTVGLITRRSQVQILSPPPKKALVRTTIRPGLLSFSGPFLPDLSSICHRDSGRLWRACHQIRPGRGESTRYLDDSLSEDHVPLMNARRRGSGRVECSGSAG
jgi:hypothetical protein